MRTDAMPPEGTFTLVHLQSMASLLEAGPAEVASRLSDLLLDFVPHQALLIFDLDDVGNPLKMHGDPRFASRINYRELESIKKDLTGDGQARTDRSIGEVPRPVLSALAKTGALLVLVDPGPAGRDHVIASLWELVAEHLHSRAREASPTYLMDSRTAASVRVEAVTALGDRQMTTLESLLAVLRSKGLDDRAARQEATKLATEAAVHLKTATDNVLTFTEEPVTSAFARLRDDLRPLVKYRDLDVQFIEPPVDGRALPSEVAHGARAVVRGAILALVDQTDVTRVRVQWDCDGKNLLIDVRDDGPGNLTIDSVQLQPLRQRVQALDGRVSMSSTAGWGSEMSVVLPLDPPPLIGDSAILASLSTRELQVIECVVAGLRNAAIAARLGISENTVKFHVSKIFRKLSVSSRAELAGIFLSVEGVTGRLRAAELPIITGD